MMSLSRWITSMVSACILGACSSLQAHVVLLDFGGTAVSKGAGPANDPVNTWNTVSSAVGHSSTGSMQNLLSTTNLNTGFGLQMIQRFSDTNSSGTTAFEGLPSNATRDSMFGNRGTYSGLTNIMPEFYLFGLDPTKVYNFGVYGSRLSSGDNREGKYSFFGAQESVLYYDAADNVSRLGNLNGIAPDEEGRIRILITPGPNNTNVTGFFYLGVLQIHEVPEPSVSWLLLAGGVALGLQRRRRPRQ